MPCCVRYKPCSPRSRSFTARSATSKKSASIGSTRRKADATIWIGLDGTVPRGPLPGTPTRLSTAIAAAVNLSGGEINYRKAAVARLGAALEPQSAKLFDHLVGAGEQGRRDFEAERLGGFEIDHKLVLGRCLYRQVARLLAFEDAIHIGRRAPVAVNQVGPVGH